MKTMLMFAALAFVGIGMTPAIACDGHTTHTTAAESLTVVACAGGKCEAPQPSTQQEQAK